MVMIGKIMSLALMAVLIFPPLAVAADPPDLKGALDRQDSLHHCR